MALFILVVLFCPAVVFSQTSGTNGVSIGCHGEADIFFLIDTSVNIRDEDRQQSTDFVRYVINHLDIGLERTRVGVAISQSPHVRVNLTTFGDRSLLLNATDYATREPDTNTDFPSALRDIRSAILDSAAGAREHLPKVLFILANDRLQITDEALLGEIRLLKDEEVIVIMLLYGNSQSTEVKRRNAPSLVSTPYDRNLFLYSSSDALALQTPRDDVTGRICRHIFAAALTASFYIHSEHGVRLAVAVFGDTTRSVFQLNTFSGGFSAADQMIDSILAIPYHEDSLTNTHLALTFTRTAIFNVNSGDRDDVTNICVVVTDGHSSQPVQTALEARRLKDTNTRIFAIGVGALGVPEFQEELITIGSAPASEHVFEVDAFSSLRFIEETLIARTCRPSVPVCEASTDVVFVLDSSGSISRQDFRRVMEFVRMLTERLLPRAQDVGGAVTSQSARVGIMTFSSEPEPLMYLNDIERARDIAGQLQDVKPARGRTHTHLALQYASDVMLSAENGNRPEAPDRLVVFSDGSSSDPEATQRVANEVKSSGVGIVTLGVGEWTRPEELTNMASWPEVQNSFHVAGYDALVQVADLITGAVCDVVDECTSSPCVRGSCENGMNRYFCRCDPGFTGRHCDQECPHLSDVIFVLDRSGSIEEENFYVMQGFVRDVIAGLDVAGGSRVGLVSFSSEARVEFGLGSYGDLEQLLGAVNIRFSGGTTNTAQALRLVRDLFAQSTGAGVWKQAVLLTDGKSDDSEATLAEAVGAREEGIHLVVLGVGQSTRLYELQGIASDPDESNMFMVRDFNALTGGQAALLDSLCNKVNECASNPCHNGATCIDGVGQFLCQCTDQHNGPMCDRGCPDPLDVVFLIDNSGSVARENFEHVIAFVKDVIDQLDLDSGNVQVGALSFNDASQVEFYLDSYASRDQAKYGLERMRFQGGRTDTSAALKLMREDMFNNSHGDRDRVPNMAVLITDGVPNVNQKAAVLEAINAKIDGTHIVLVTVGEGMTRGRVYIQLQGIPSDPVSENYFTVERYSQLHTLVDRVARAVCNDISECSSSPCQNGGRCEDGLRMYTCHCPDRFSGQNCQRECQGMHDVVLVTDISGSIEDDEGFSIELAFLHSLLHGFNFNFGATRVGHITFYNNATSQFYLDTYSSSTAKRDLLHAVTLDYVGHQTNITAGLMESLLYQFPLARAGVRTQLVLLSDGHVTVTTPDDVIMAANRLKLAGVEIYSVGIGPNPNSALLVDVASNPRNYVNVRTPNDISQEVDELLDLMCT